MTASIGSFTFDAMQGRLSPAPALSDATMGLAHRGKLSPIVGTIMTQKVVAGVNNAVALSASYRAIIGTKQSCIINGTTISDVVVIDCGTSYKTVASGRVLTAEWSLAAPQSWNP